jgi:hypothetical protein
MRRKVPLYTKRRYWYHVSTTLRRKVARLTPWDEDKSVNRGGSEPPGPRICVAPTIEQCLVAVPYSSCGHGFTVYRTKSPVLATRPYPTKDIFDWKVTREGWLLKPTTFIKIGSIRPSEIMRGEKIDELIDAAACCSNLKDSKIALKWWKNLKLKRRYLRRV